MNHANDGSSHRFRRILIAIVLLTLVVLITFFMTARYERGMPSVSDEDDDPEIRFEEPTHDPSPTTEEDDGNPYEQDPENPYPGEPYEDTPDPSYINEEDDESARENDDEQ